MEGQRKPLPGLQIGCLGRGHMGARARLELAGLLNRVVENTPIR